MNHLGDYDVIVIGAGHAGIEAAHAAAMLGAKTAVFTMSLDAIGNMPCNPSIGGTAKGTLVRELDALGGVMGLAADATYLQSRMLNKGKGPAVHALRVQTDRKRYHEYMKHALELTPGLAIHQAEIISIEVEDGHVKGVVTQLNGEYGAKCVVIATGTNLGGKIFVGDAWYASGPDGMHAANALTESLKAAGLPLRRFKTGTPARVHRRSIDFSKLECQPGDPDNELQPFSFMTDAPMHNKVECWIAYTNPETHKIILDNIQRSPLYGGMIEGVGPRYCPSIEDKVVRFSGKDRHPLFVEPCGENTEEMYLQGASSSLPEATSRSCGQRASTASDGRKCARSQPTQGPIGISSMKRTCHGCVSVRAAKSAISSSLTPPRSTQLSLRFWKPALCAASSPRSTSASEPTRVMSRKRSGRSVSRLMFRRSTPAARSGAASAGRRTPFVVRQSSSMPGISRSMRHSSTIPRRTSGSPPVRRIFRIPSFTAARAISPYSSTERTAPWGPFSTPSAGIQYWHR